MNMETLLELPEWPDAVFSSSDFAAMGAMQVCKERKIQIPGQIAMVGFSNDPFTKFTDPPLTTVDQFSLMMGKVTAELFFEQLAAKDNQKMTRRIVLKPELIIRQSSQVKPEDQN